MRFLVFQHVAAEHPGLFRDIMRSNGIEWDVVQWDQDLGKSHLKSLDDYQALLVMGGPMDVWQTDKLPWLIDEKAAICQWVRNLERPYLGVCLGHQLLVDALGGEVGLMQKPEVGIYHVTLSPAASRESLLDGVGSPLICLQWHGAEVKKLPIDGIGLASSPECNTQAVRCGKHAYGIQFHMEVTDTMFNEWLAIPEYGQSLERVLGPSGEAAFRRDFSDKKAVLTACATRIFDNFLDVVRSR